MLRESKERNEKVKFWDLDIIENRKTSGRSLALPTRIRESDCQRLFGLFGVPAKVLQEPIGAKESENGVVQVPRI